MSTMQYELHLNLQQRAALRSAISFWKRKEVKDKAAEVFESCNELWIEIERRQWLECTKSVVDEWNKDELPQILEAELIHLVKMIGQTIFSWYQYIKHEYKAKKEAINCIDQIKWTPYGTVDVVKTFKSSWLENPNLDITTIYNFACRYAITDHINKLWNKIPCEKQKNCYKDIYKRFDQHILAYWKHLRDNDLPNLMRHLQVAANDSNEDMDSFNLIYDLNRSTEENMLRLTIHQGHFIATKYFWAKLTEEERDECVLKCAYIAALCYDDYLIEDRTIGDYKTSQYVEICIFLMNQMSDDHKKAFFNNLDGYDFEDFNCVDVIDRILQLLLFTWPWQKLFIPVLKDILQYLDDNSKMSCLFLNAITSKMYEDHKLGYALETSKYRCLLREAWIIIPASIKQKIPLPDDSDDKFVDNLIRVWDLSSLKLILNDPAIADVRDEFIWSGSCSYDELIEKGAFEKLDQFIKEMFMSEEEKKEFKQNIDVLDTFFYYGKFDLVNKLLDWQYSTLEERQSAKNNIKYLRYCKIGIEKCDYDYVDKLLNWRFDTEEEKRNCKNHFKSDIFPIKRLCEIWKKKRNDINQAKEKCSEFLNWLLESEEDIAHFKKDKIFKFLMDDLIINRLVRFKRDGFLDDFISWCLLDDEKIQKIKRAVSERN